MGLLENMSQASSMYEGSRPSQRHRPRSAMPATTKMFQNSLGISQNAQAFMEEEGVQKIWNAFGSYIAKQLRNGKGVIVPRFGNFTFQASDVDLAGTTNPQLRDKQHREPVFIVGKDFVSAVNLRAGVSHYGGSQIRPIDLKGSSGIIPKCKANYFEIGTFCDQSKDACRTACEQIFRNLSDKVRRGENVVQDIPLVGRFVVRNGLAAITFSNDVIEETRGVTAKGFSVGKLFSNSNGALNLNIHQQNLNKSNPKLGLGGALRVSNGAQEWLRGNLDVDFEELPNEVIPPMAYSEKSNRIQSANIYGRQPPTMGARSGSMNNFRQGQRLQADNLSRNQESTLTENNKFAFDQISQSNYSQAPSRRSIQRPLSAVTGSSMQSRMSHLPHLGRMQVMMVANSIFKHRSTIMEQIKVSRYQARDVLSSSQILHILKKAGVFVEITHLKVLLKELGYAFNGPSCSFTQLFTSCKGFLAGVKDQPMQMQSAPTRQHLIKSASEMSAHGGSQQSMDVGKLLQHLRDLFYSTRKNLYEIFKLSKTGNSIDFEGFRKLIKQVSHGLMDDHSIEVAFRAVAKRGASISFEQFEQTFRSEVPTGTNFETKVIRKLRDWMYDKKLSAEMAFDQFCRQTDRHVERTLSRTDFHRAIHGCQINLSAAETDALFAALNTDQTGNLTLTQWRARVYEDGDNPLQMIREIVQNNGLTADDLLFQMKLRVWDLPLNRAAFLKAARNLDQSLGDNQISELFKTLKNDDEVVEIASIVRNFTGSQFETVDYRNMMFKKLYSDIYPQREEKIINLFQQVDTDNDGLINAEQMLSCLSKVSSQNQENLQRFVRMLDKDKLGRINFMDFLQKLTGISNRDHNPFKSLVQRLDYFLKQNKLSTYEIIKRLAGDSGVLKVENDIFASFIKQKVDKKRDEYSISMYVNQMDVDKDGYITEEDLNTCIKNLNNMAFFKNQGAALSRSTFNTGVKFYPNSVKISREKSLEICKQIREALALKKMSFRGTFEKFDTNRDNMVSYAEFSRGLSSLVKLSQPVMEQIYALMDKNNIGLITYEQFLDVLRLQKIDKQTVQDNFDWETDIIQKIKNWIIKQRITVEEAFKCFDNDFDGHISKDDLKNSLVELLEVPPSQILPTKLDRLFRLLDFFKTGKIQVSDFQRLLSNENPYHSTKIVSTASSLSRSLGGGLSQTSTFDWKFSSIQQIGLVLSKKYATVTDSFVAACDGQGKVSFNNFKQFLEKEDALSGFNLTVTLVQQLFSELDPHKKGYLNRNDWKNAFGSFSWNDQLLVELKNQIQCSFVDCESAFNFFGTMNKQGAAGKAITKEMFTQGVKSLTNERFKIQEIASLWSKLTDDCERSTIDKYLFRRHFETLNYSGYSAVRSVPGSRVASSNGSRATIQTKTSSQLQWETDILEKLRNIVNASTKTLEDIFKEFDSDNNGFISDVEFREALRRLNLGLTSRQIDQVMARLDTNQDGQIDWNEFSSKFKQNSYDQRLSQRNKPKMARLKELMMLHMTSANDAFRHFDTSKNGKLTYPEFKEMVTKLKQLSREENWTHLVIKDMFDQIDIRKDGEIDLHEWQQTFGKVTEGDNQLSIKATPLTMWENSPEFARLGSLISKSRKLIIDHFKKVLGSTNTVFNFAQGKEAMDDFIYKKYGSTLSDEKLQVVFSVARLHKESQVGETVYDYVRMLDTYKSRFAGSQM